MRALGRLLLKFCAGCRYPKWRKLSVRTLIAVIGLVLCVAQGAIAATATSCYKATMLEFNPLSSNATLQLSGGKKEMWHVLGGSEQVSVFAWRPLDVVSVCTTGVDNIFTLADVSDTTDPPAHARKVPAK
jgi:hypothetical protein